MKRIILSFFIIFTAISLYAVTDSKGKEFWIVFPGTHEYAGGGEKTLYITSQTTAGGTVEAPGLAFSQAFTVLPYNIISIQLPLEAELVDAINDHELTGHKGIHITADNEITVYGLSRLSYITDAFIAMPVDSLGTQYVNATYTNTQFFPGSEFAVVATQDNTRITINPSQSAGGRAAGISYDIYLDEGWAYQLRSGADTGDLTGTLIQSDKPVAAFGAHKCVLIPAGYQACDYIIEQLMPVTSWGKEFAIIPLAGRTGGDTYRVLAGFDGTSVSINGASITLNTGEFYESLYSLPLHIVSDKPIQVMQYSNGTGFDSAAVADPFMMTIIPNEQFLTSYTVVTPDNYFTDNYINIVVSDAGAGSVTLDGAAVPSGLYIPIGASGYSGAQVPVSTGVHRLTSPEPFEIYMYGYNMAVSYGYPGGCGVVDLLSTKTVTPTVTPTVSPTVTPTNPHTPTVTPTLTITYTLTMTPSPTVTPVPLVLALEGNFPNPFMYETRIVYWLSKDAGVVIKIFTVSGEAVNVIEGIKGYGGYNSFLWDGRNGKGDKVASGVFIYKISARSYEERTPEITAKLACVK